MGPTETDPINSLRIKAPHGAWEQVTLVLPAVFCVLLGTSLYGFYTMANSKMMNIYNQCYANNTVTLGDQGSPCPRDMGAGGSAQVTAYEFGGFVVHSYLLPFVAVPLLVWLTSCSKLLTDPKHAAAFHACVAAVLLVLGSVCLANWGQFWDKTVITQGEVIKSGPRDKTANSGYMIVTGVGLWAVCFSLAVVQLTICIRRFKPGFLRYARTGSSDGVVVGLFLGLVLPFCFFLTCLLPNWSLIFAPGSIFRQTDPTDAANWDSRSGSSVKFGSVYLIMYWDVFIYYLFLYVLCAVALAGKYVPVVQKILSCNAIRGNVLSAGNLGYWSIGEILLVLWFVGLLAAETIYWSGDHYEGKSGTDYDNSKGAGAMDKDGNYTSTQQWARIFGQLANVVLSLLALPTARSSVWSKMLGVSWEAMQQYHVALGYCFIWTTAIHQFLWWGFWDWQGKNLDFTCVPGANHTWSVAGVPVTGFGPGLAPLQCGFGPGNQYETGLSYGQVGDFPRDILAVPVNYHSDNYSNPLIQIVWWTMVVCMGVFAFNKIRRNYFELFYYTHHCYLVIYVGALWHATSLWYYLIIGLGLYFVDRLIRHSRGCKVVGGLSVTAQGRIDSAHAITRLEIQTLDGLAPMFEAGQYGFINVPEISALQWHPFTISSAPCEEKLQFNIKTMGSGTWTESLHQLASSCQHLEMLPQVNYDGPYGLGLDWQQYERIILVVGGVGVTPALSILKELYDPRGSHNVKLEFVWSIASIEVLNNIGVADMFETYQDGSSFNIQVFVTREKAGPEKK